MDIGEVLAGMLVERRASHLLQHLSDHHRDPHELAGLLDGKLVI